MNFDRYYIVSEDDIAAALDSASSYVARKRSYRRNPGERRTSSVMCPWLEKGG